MFRNMDDSDILKNMKLSRRAPMLVDRIKITSGWNYRVYPYYKIYEQNVFRSLYLRFPQNCT